jgi:AhpD family alkylhydroperoxidase
MKTRLNYSKAAPGGYKAMLGLEEYVEKSGLDARLRQLVCLRASQINHCAYCIDMHAGELRTLGESAPRIDLLTAWREAPFYSERERAALAWTEAVTTLAPDFVPDDVFAQAQREFNERELVDLTLAIAAINAWNRLSVSFRSVPESFKAVASSSNS